MMNRVEMNEEMMELVNGGKPSNSPCNPYSPNAANRYFPTNEKKGNEDAK